MFSVAYMDRFFLISKEEINNSEKWLRILSSHKTNGAHVVDIFSLEGLQNMPSDFSLVALQEWAATVKGMSTCFFDFFKIKTRST